VLDKELLMLFSDGVDTSAEVVLGRPGDKLDAETPIDMEMLLVVNVELPRGGDVNGWLDADTVDSGYGPIWLELEAVAEVSVGDPAALLLLETDDVEPECCPF